MGRGPKRRKAAIVDEDSSDEFQFDVSLADIDDGMFLLLAILKMQGLI